MERTGKRAPAGAAGALYIVGTPIGNPEDISLRALRILREADVIAAEDTRVTGRLLARFGVTTPLTPYQQHSAGGKAQSLTERIERGERVALVSDAGMPGISDPGWELIGLCIERGLPVVPVPGPSAATAALAASGLPSQRFTFEGFPPRRRSGRLTYFERFRDETRTIVLYESPRRLRETLTDLAEVLDPARRLAIAVDLTKPGEVWRRGTLAEILRYFTGRTPRGEVALVLEGVQASRGPRIGKEMPGL